MTVLVRVGTVAASRRFGFELVKPSSVVVTGSGSESATVSALGSVEFSAAATLSLNDVFSSGYDNYMVVYRGSATANNAFYVRFRTSGTDATGSNYTHQYLYALETTVDAGRGTSQTAGRIAYVSTSLRQGFIFNVFGPFLAQPTAGRSVTALDFPFTGDPAYIDDNAITHSLSTAYDGITIYPGSGAISGRVAVYGMRG